MGKKDLLERISRGSTEAPVVRRVEVAPPVARATDDQQQKRVSKRVIRRRRKGDTAEAAPAPVVRRRAVESVEPVEVSTPETVAAPEPAPEPVVAEPVTAPEPVAEPEPAPEPVAAAVEPVAVEPTPEPVVEAPAPEPTPEPVAAQAPEPAPAPASDDPKLRPKGALPGLGSAVVVAPPGYDPTNPEAFRKTIEAQQAQQAQQRNLGHEPGTTAWRSRRRVENTGAPAKRPGERPGGRGPARRQRRTGFDSPHMRRKPRRRRTGPKKVSPAPKGAKRNIKIDNVVSVGQLAKDMMVKASAVIRILMDMDQMVRINDMLDFDTAVIVAQEFEYEVENVGFQESNFLQHVEAEEDDSLVARPPVVTIMGHVDHGKTTLLDAIRDARVAAGEAGGITQHVGAYQVKTDNGVVTFIDTPGHAAFTAMRARGASVTDIVILVVAVDDGVQPQTEEAINHAKAAGVPVVVAINKMDKVDANPDTIKTRLSEFGLAPEEWGGETLYAPVSALKGEGLDNLLEQVMLQAELLDLRANADRHAEGVVIEAKMERGRGAVASVLVQKGTLNRGDFVVLGAAFGKVRAMLDDQGKKLKTAGPSTPVEIFGLSELPAVGDILSVVKSEKDARKLASHRAQDKRDAEMTGSRAGMTAEELFAAAAGSQNQQLQIVLKADVQGSLEALKGALLNLDVDGAEIRILHSAVGNVSESDINLIASNNENSVLIAFNVKVDPKARRTADGLGVMPHLKQYDVIYGALDYVESRMKGLLEPEYEQVRQGSAEVRATFSISKIGTIAGLYVLDGKMYRNGIAKLVRDGKTMWEGKVSTLKRFKDDVKEVATGYECGLSLDGFNDIINGDIIECYTLEEIKRD